MTRIIHDRNSKKNNRINRIAARQDHHTERTFILFLHESCRAAILLILLFHSVFICVEFL